MRFNTTIKFQVKLVKMSDVSTLGKKLYVFSSRSHGKKKRFLERWVWKSTPKRNNKKFLLHRSTGS